MALRGEGVWIAPLLGFIWVLSVRPERPFRLLNLAPAALALLLFVGAYGVYREANSLAAPTATQLLEQIVNEGAGGILARVLGRFDSFDFMVWVVERYPTERAEFLLGRSAIDFLGQPLPRSVTYEALTNINSTRWKPCRTTMIAVYAGVRTR